MSIGDIVIVILSGIAICAVCAFVMVWAAQKTIHALGWRDRARLDSAHRKDLRDLIARAEAKGLYVPESLRSAAA